MVDEPEKLTLNVRPLIMKLATAILGIVCVLICGCTDSEHPTSETMIIIPGFGVTNVISLGMSVSDMRRMNPDMTYRRSPRIRMPWQDKEYGTRLPWEEPREHSGMIPALGIDWGCTYHDKNVPFRGHIDFYIAPESNSNLRPFQGSLSWGLRLTPSVTPVQVTRHYGEPERTIPFDSNILHLARAGISHRVVVPRQGIELLYYPNDGILFDFREGLLRRLSVYPKNKRVEP